MLVLRELSTQEGYIVSEDGVTVANNNNTMTTKYKKMYNILGLRFHRGNFLNSQDIPWMG